MNPDWFVFDNLGRLADIDFRGQFSTDVVDSTLINRNLGHRTLTELPPLALTLAGFSITYPADAGVAQW